MALTKTQFYLSTVFVVIVFFSTFTIMGIDLVNNARIDLNDKSLDYIAEMKGISTESGFEGVADTDSAESQLVGVLDSEDNKTVIDNIDFLATLQIKKERASRPTNVFKIIYNVPTALVVGMGFSLSDFNHLINIITYFLVTGIILLVWRIIK